MTAILQTAAAFLVILPVSVCVCLLLDLVRSLRS